jgi:Zn-finger nucleic acid-binding protein
MDRCTCGARRVAWNESGGAGSCVRCRAELSPVAVEETTAHLDVCPKCLGCFVRTPDLGELLDRAEAGKEARLPGALQPAAGPTPASPDRLQLVNCPHCSREMDRTRFAQRASLVVDVCPVHGMWLDAGELQGLLAFVKDRAAGVAAPGAIEREDEEKWKRIVAERLSEENQVTARVAFATAEAARRNRGMPSDD